MESIVTSSHFLYDIYVRHASVCKYEIILYSWLFLHLSLLLFLYSFAFIFICHSVYILQLLFVALSGPQTGHLYCQKRTIAASAGNQTSCSIHGKPSQVFLAFIAPLYCRDGYRKLVEWLVRGNWNTSLCPHGLNLQSESDLQQSSCQLHNIGVKDDKTLFTYGILFAVCLRKLLSLLFCGCLLDKLVQTEIHCKRNVSSCGEQY